MARGKNATCCIVYYTDAYTDTITDDVHICTLLILLVAIYSYAVCYHVGLDVREVGHDYHPQIQMYLEEEIL